jgi:integrase
VSPVDQTEPPGTPRSNPDPPTPTEAAALLNEAWNADPDWGTLVWLIMTTGSRRGEVCGLRWSRLDLDHAGVAVFKRSTGQLGREVWEKDTKSHQDRRVTLDPEIIEVLKEHRARCEARAAELGVTIARDAYVFSPVPDGSTPTRPDTVTQRYLRLASRLGINTRLHSLRHFSATELIAAGVDVRTVAGRLGHSGGGSTTLRIYTGAPLTMRPDGRAREATAVDPGSRDMFSSRSHRISGRAAELIEAFEAAAERSPASSSLSSRSSCDDGSRVRCNRTSRCS